MTDYTPIDCGLHSEYELAIIQQRRLRVCWQVADGPTHIDILTPLDLITRKRAEFMLARTRDGRQLELRLDHILSADAL